MMPRKKTPEDRWTTPPFVNQIGDVRVVGFNSNDDPHVWLDPADPRADGFLVEIWKIPGTLDRGPEDGPNVRDGASQRILRAVGKRNAMPIPYAPVYARAELRQQTHGSICS